MAINLEKITDNIVKIARGLGYNIKMYDEFGNGPISSSKTAKYIFLEPDGILFSIPSLNGNETDKDIYIYVGNKKNVQKFADLLKRIRIIAKMDGMGITLKNEYNLERITPDYLAHEARSAREENQE